MRSVLPIAIGFVALASLPGGTAHARRMEKVLAECSQQNPFPAYAACIKDTYSKKGNQKTAGAVLAFYAYLDETLEEYQRSQATDTPMTETKARAAVFRAWQATIEASNKADAADIPDAPAYKPKKQVFCHKGIGGTAHCFEQ